MKIISRIETDTTISLWDYKGLSTEQYNSIGKYFAKKDLTKGIHIIYFNDYGCDECDNPTPCIECRYKKYGFELKYKAVYGDEFEILDGYNEISSAYLKSVIGEKAYNEIHETPMNYFVPEKFLSKLTLQKNCDLEVINDSTIYVHFEIKKSLISDYYPSLTDKLRFVMTYINAENKADSQTLGLNEISNKRFIIKSNKDGKYFIEIKFSFENLTTKEKFDYLCYCNNEEQFTYKLPINLIKE